MDDTTYSECKRSLHAIQETGQLQGNFIAHFVARQKDRKYKYLKSWSEWQDSNLRPLRPERSALPG